MCQIISETTYLVKLVSFFDDLSTETVTLFTPLYLRNDVWHYVVKHRP